jgi:hypothetical protein
MVTSQDSCAATLRSGAAHAGVSPATGYLCTKCETVISHQVLCANFHTFSNEYATGLAYTAGPQRVSAVISLLAKQPHLVYIHVLCQHTGSQTGKRNQCEACCRRSCSSHVCDRRMQPITMQSCAISELTQHPETHAHCHSAAHNQCGGSCLCLHKAASSCSISIAPRTPRHPVSIRKAAASCQMAS